MNQDKLRDTSGRDQSVHYVVDDASWEELIELTGGAAALCYQCGVCTAGCPWGLVRDEYLNVRTFMRQAQLGFHDRNESLWLCTACAQCEGYCPRGVEISEVFRGLRNMAWEHRVVEPGLPSILWSVYWNGNPWSQPPSQRGQWAHELGIPDFDPERHEILLYIGCTSSYDRRAQKVAQALVKLLKAAGVSFGYLGEYEPCCGESVLSLGHKRYFKEIAQDTQDYFRQKGVTTLVAISPHCFDVFKNHYPNTQNKPGLEPYHYTQYLAELINSGRLQFGLDCEEPNVSEENHQLKVTFQDPCFLGRHNGEYEAPRRILSALPHMEIIEMKRNSQDGLCCGGGGGRMWLETAPGERFSDRRVLEAAECGASVLATACPFCLVCLEDSVKSAKSTEIEVLDVAEIAALRLAHSNLSP